MGITQFRIVKTTLSMASENPRVGKLNMYVMGYKISKRTK